MGTLFDSVVVLQTRASVSDVELCFSRDGVFLVIDEKQHERNRKGYKFCGGSCEPKSRHVPQVSKQEGKRNDRHHTAHKCDDLGKETFV